MRAGLVRVSGRPSHVEVDGWMCWVELHDRLYRAERRRWKARLAAAHPDAGGTAWRFRAAYAGYQRWLRREARWYAHVGLTPPSGVRSLGALTQRRPPTP